MNKNALLASAAAIDSLIALNSGQVALAQTSFNFPITVNQTSGPAVQIITVGSTTNPACLALPAGQCTYPSPSAVFNALAGDYSKVYDVQIEPDTYVYHVGDKGKIDFNGTVEGMGTIVSGITLGNGTVVSTTAPGVTIVNYGAGAQALWIVGTSNSPYPGNNLVIKNIEFNGTVTSPSPAKQARCIQMQSVGNILIQGDAFVNCQMGIVGDPWTPTDGSGVLLVSGSVFNNNCSNSGPSHSIYETTGTLAVGTVTVSMNGVNVTGLPNTFGECSIGYNTKSRSKNTFVEGNYYYQNFVCPSSGAIDIPETMNLVISGNIMTFGPLTGSTCNSVTTTTDATQVGGTLGSFQPTNWIIQGNTMIAQGVTKTMDLVRNIQNLPGTLLVGGGNKVLLASQMSNVLTGLGTVAAGNIYADGSAVTPYTETQRISGAGQYQDFRGTSGPQTPTIAGYATWGGNGLLTGTYNSSAGAYVAGGPGGVNIAAPHGQNYIWVWTAPNSSNTITAANGNFEFFTFGTNDQIGIGTVPSSGGPLCSSDNPILAMGGTTTVTYNAHNGTTGEITCVNKTENGGTLIVNGDVYDSTNSPITQQLWPSSKMILQGKLGRPGTALTNSTLIENNLTIVSTTNSMVFNGTLTGGGAGAGANVTIASGKIASVSGWNEGSYESSSGSPTAIRNDPVSILYTAAFTGGGTIYPGIDKLSVTGSNRALGPQPRLIAVHIQSAAPGSYINGNYSPLAIYLDGPGQASATTTSGSQAPTYVEIDLNGSGSIEIQQSWAVAQGDSCHLGAGVTLAGSIHTGGNDVLTFSNGGTAQFDSSSGVVCS